MIAAHPNRCTLAYWHHPRHSSAQQTRENTSVQPLWQALAEAGADVVLTGHVHHYERIAPLDGDGKVDRARGIRSFVVGAVRDPVHPVSVAEQWAGGLRAPMELVPGRDDGLAAQTAALRERVARWLRR